MSFGLDKKLNSSYCLSDIENELSLLDIPEDIDSLGLEDEFELQNKKNKRPKLPSLSKKKNPTIVELEFIFDTKGCKSKEFYIYVKSFIFFVIRRYHGEPTDDLLNNCYLRLFELLDTFDKTKGKLASFIFSICRNEITKYQYRLKKIEKESFVDVSFDQDRCSYVNDVVEMDVDSYIIKQQYFLNFTKLKFSKKFIEDYSKGIVSNESISKTTLWDTVNII